MQRNRLLPIAAFSGLAILGLIGIQQVVSSPDDESVRFVNTSQLTTAPPASERALESVNAIPLQSGTFAQPLEGTAQIVEDEGGLYLEFGPTFRGPNQGEAEVLLSPDVVPPGSYTAELIESYLNLGRLVATEGEQRYLIPPGTDPKNIGSVIVLSPDAADTPGYAPLEPGAIAQVIEPEPEAPTATPAEPPTETALGEPITIQAPPAAPPTETAQAVPVAPPAETAQAVPTTPPAETAQATPAAPPAETQAPAAAPTTAPRALW